ncbi:hypothetical protein PYW08_009562 [Mythimna loreyi]|uniref:Uncharacterized protein n=1 Tax=Mythimna loreyi TaxID=667449 RepID=A0ACC2Q838_9NEOP|nr:hypothetical protein PYW08_009562 [Mythimna loreyi]
MKLEWDSELAFLAQILANQCLGGRGDLCRATDRFPNPSQTIAIIRYKYPDWEYLKPNNTEKGLNEEKLIFAMNKFFKSTHALRKTVTKEIIMNCPPSQELPDINLKFYLNLIRGGSTHIGCGISAYTKLKISDGSKTMQNNVQIVCNISDAPKLKQSVYRVVPPSPVQGYTKRCGCPRGYKETRSCLCERDLAFQWNGQQDADLKQDPIQTRLENNEDNNEAMFAEQPQLSIHDFSENKNKQTNGIETPHSMFKSRNIIRLKGNQSDVYSPEENNAENIDKFSEITSAIIPKNKHINSRLTNDRPSLDIKLSKSQNSKPAIIEDTFDDIIFKVNSYVDKETTTERIIDIAEENLVDIATDKTDEDAENPERRTSIVTNRRQRLQLNPFSRKNKNEELHQILLRRPNHIDALRLLINQPRKSIYSSETETFEL